jgi:hypothetical protein
MQDQIGCICEPSTPMFHDGLLSFLVDTQIRTFCCFGKTPLILPVDRGTSPAVPHVYFEGRHHEKSDGLVGYTMCIEKKSIMLLP